MIGWEDKSLRTLSQKLFLSLQKWRSYMDLVTTQRSKTRQKDTEKYRPLATVLYSLPYLKKCKHPKTDSDHLTHCIFNRSNWDTLPGLVLLGELCIGKIPVKQLIWSAISSSSHSSSSLNRFIGGRPLPLGLRPALIAAVKGVML